MSKLGYDPRKMKCPHCGTGDAQIHSFLCPNHPTPYIYGANLAVVARKDGKQLTAKDPR